MVDISNPDLDFRASGSNLILYVLSLIIMKCLKKAPDERFQTGGAVGEALKGCLGKRELAVPRETSTEKNQKESAILY